MDIKNQLNNFYITAENQKGEKIFLCVKDSFEIYWSPLEYLSLRNLCFLTKEEAKKMCEGLISEMLSFQKRYEKEYNKNETIHIFSFIPSDFPSLIDYNGNLILFKSVSVNIHKITLD